LRDQAILALRRSLPSAGLSGIPPKDPAPPQPTEIPSSPLSSLTTTTKPTTTTTTTLLERPLHLRRPILQRVQHAYLHLSHKASSVSYMVYVRSEIECAPHFETKFQERKDPVVTLTRAVRLGCAHSVPLSWFIVGVTGVNNDSGGEGGSMSASIDSGKVGEGNDGKAGKGSRTCRKRHQPPRANWILSSSLNHRFPCFRARRRWSRFRMAIIDFSEQFVIWLLTCCFLLSFCSSIRFRLHVERFAGTWYSNAMIIKTNNIDHRSN
jgi:hypothetical protein